MAERRKRETVATGILRRHERHCQGKRCSCSPSYVARLMVGGEPYEASFSTQEEAEAWRGNTRRTLRSGGAVSAPEPSTGKVMPLGDVLVTFLGKAHRGELLNRSGTRYAANTLLGYERAARKLREHVDTPTGLRLAALPVANVDARTAQRAVDAISRKSNEVGRYAAAMLSVVLTFAFDEGLRDDPAPKLRRPKPGKGRVVSLTVDQTDALLEAAAEDDSRFKRSLAVPYMALLEALGGREEEVRTLRWEDVDLSSNPATVAIRKSKTEAGMRVLGLDAETVAILRKHKLATGGGEYVFSKADGKPFARGGALRYVFKRVKLAAGLPGLTPHGLRHAHASALVAEGVPLPDVAARLGHVDGSFTLRRYAHATSTQAAVVDVLTARRERARCAQVVPNVG